MGRPKEFDRDQVLAKATDLFWRFGFSKTSTQQLVEHLGINRKSIYAEFGCKQGLFEATLERYNKVIVDRNFGPLESSSGGLSEIEEIFRLFARESRGRGSGLGCLLCNTAVEQAPDDSPTGRLVDRYIRRVTCAFRNALENAQGCGEIDVTVNTLAQARFFTSAVLGMSVLARAKATPAMIDGTVQVTLDHLASLVPESA